MLYLGTSLIILSNLNFATYITNMHYSMSLSSPMEISSVLQDNTCMASSVFASDISL